MEPKENQEEQEMDEFLDWWIPLRYPGEDIEEVIDRAISDYEEDPDY